MLRVQSELNSYYQTHTSVGDPFIPTSYIEETPLYLIQKTL